ncbi:MAG: hypothetical protein BTN85_1833 [Candidatus Methanohalarchaeum thermophilum]|uniref:Uncharacterized protein n=1 Tax=Methanohalarchaeum thermophilum TaxID=1903181 RepID=A0A1Q6DS37_METT1|nr:MAG: hypothetical protein BTN85_1833 [Candidatus Methanohalarchaeum thermophilum]
MAVYFAFCLPYILFKAEILTVLLWGECQKISWWENMFW